MVGMSIGGVSTTPNHLTAEKIQSFASFPKGWHYGGGGPASPEMVRIALGYLYQLMVSGFGETDAFFGPDGQIMVTAYLGKHCVEVTVDLDRSFTVTHQIGGEDRSYEPELSGPRASLEVARVVSVIEREECGTFGWSTQETLIIGQVSSRISPLRSPAMVAARPFFMNNAASIQAVRCAPILPDSTLELEESLRFSGCSQAPASIRVAV